VARPRTKPATTRFAPRSGPVTAPDLLCPRIPRSRRSRSVEAALYAART
jgi:hypothetical protein